MRALIQRVSRAQVRLGGRPAGTVGQGLLVLLGIHRQDTRSEAEYLARKAAGLRIFEDSGGKLNLSLQDIGGGMLVVSQFTLYGDCRKGRRPSFVEAAPPEQARGLYEHFCQAARSLGVPVETGVFQETMEVELVNQGPVTILLERP